MIAKPFRFHGYGSLRYVYRNGKTVRNSLLSLKFAQNERRNKYRVSVVVSKKVSKSAVVRNRIRRRIYEIIRLNQELLTAPYDIIITVFNEQVATLPHQELQTSLNSLFKQAKLTK